MEGRDCENARWSGRRRRLVGALLVLVLAPSLVAPAACRWGGRRGTLPATLTDEEFWRLSSEFSEPPGAFEHSDNLVSNEAHIVHMVPMLRPMRGVYIGVGPEQNFTYIARLQPAMAFIVDIREENRSLHLMYKALFEVSTDRADFVARLFSRERPAGVGSGTSAQALFARFETAKRDERLYQATTTLFRDRLLVDHRFPMSSDDLAAIDHAFNAFYTSGPDIHYGREFPGESPDPSYRFLMTATDVWGANGSYLASEDNFRFVKNLHAANLIVPVVGDFAGPQAIRRVGDYVRRHAMTVSAFYGSNVEVYLNRRQTAAFCTNLAALPFTSWTWFIGSKGMRPLRSKLETCSPVTQ